MSIQQETISKEEFEMLQDILEDLFIKHGIDEDVLKLSEKLDEYILEEQLNKLN